MLSVTQPMWAETLEQSAGIPTDVTFQVEDGEAQVQEFQAHKYYLALVSKVFKARFFGPLKETKDILVVKGTTSQAFQTMINFIYHKDCDWEKKSAVEMFEVANVAEMYDIAGLMVEVKRAVQRIPVTLSNVAELAHTAEQFSMFPTISSSLLRNCVKFLFTTLCTQVLDFSGLIFSPNHGSVVSKLHSHLLEKPLPWCSECGKFLSDGLAYHYCGLSASPFDNLNWPSWPGPPVMPLIPLPWFDGSVRAEGEDEEEEFLWNY